MVGIERPILLDIPESFETERLIIRAPRVGDGQAVNEAIKESVDSMHPWMAWAKPVPTVEASEESVRRGIARWILRESLRLMLFRKSDGLFVGNNGLHGIDWSIPSFEIGYWVRSRLEGQGYITEAVVGVTDFAFGMIGAERVQIRCDTRNERSAAVPRRAGYTLEGTLRHDGKDTEGELRSTYVFGMIRDDFLARRKSENR